MLCHTDIGMSQDFSDIFHAYLVCQKHDGSRSMPGNVCRQTLLYSTDVGYLLSVGVHFLVAQYWQKHSFGNTIRLVRIFVYQFTGG